MATGERLVAVPGCGETLKRQNLLADRGDVGQYARKLRILPLLVPPIITVHRLLDNLLVPDHPIRQKPGMTQEFGRGLLQVELELPVELRLIVISTVERNIRQPVVWPTSEEPIRVGEADLLLELLGGNPDFARE